MSRTYRKERTKPKNNKPQKNLRDKNKVIEDEYYELSNDYDYDMIRKGELEDVTL